MSIQKVKIIRTTEQRQVTCEPLGSSFVEVTLIDFGFRACEILCSHRDTTVSSRKLLVDEWKSRTAFWFSPKGN